MGVVAVKKIGRGKRSRREEPTYNRATEQQDRSIRQPYLVKTSSPLDDPAVVMSAVALPQMWTAHPTDTNIVVTSRSCEETDDPNTWIVDIEYSQVTDPTEEPAIVTVSNQSEDWAIEEDINGDAILNAARDPFDPPVTVQTGRMVIQISKNFPLFDAAAFMRQHLYTTNDLEYEIPGVGEFLTGELWVADISSKEDFKFSAFWAVQVTLHARDRGWNLKVLNAGFRALDATGRLLTVRGPDGQPVQNPALLAADGTRLGLAGTPNFLEFQVFEASDYDAMGLF